MRPIDELISDPFGKNEYFLGALIGGIFARKDAKKAAKLAAEAAKVPLVQDTDSTTSHVVDLQGMNAAAIEAGFNPRTLLNAGGLSAFTTSTAKTHNVTTGHNAMAAAQAQGAVPSMGSVFAGAAASTLDSLAGSVFKAAAPMSTSYFPPAPKQGMAAALGWTDVIGKTAAGGSAANGLKFMATPALASVQKLAMPAVPEAGDVTVTNPHHSALVDPTVRDANAYSTRYGEPGENVSAPYVAWQDYIYNRTGLTMVEREQKGAALPAYLLEGDAKKLGQNKVVQDVMVYGLSIYNKLTAPQPPAPRRTRAWQ